MRSRTSDRNDRNSGWFSDLLQDLRIAARSLAHTPGFTAIGILTIAIGVGATTAVLSMANALLIRPLPVADAERVVAVTEVRNGAINTGPDGLRIPFVRYEKYKAATRSVFSDMAAHQYHRVSLSSRGAAEPATSSLVTRNFFDVLGITPFLGSFFSANRTPDVVISHTLWRTRFGGSADAIGSQVLVDGAPYTVIGIAPPGFDGTTVPFVQDLWLPIDAYAGGTEDRWVAFFGRLAPGATLETAEPIVSAAATSIPPDERQTTVEKARLSVLTGLPMAQRDDAASFLAMLLVTALLVLLIAAANLAGMQLTRAAARRREIAVRLAIGAGRSRLVRQLLTESVVLFVAGGIGGMLVAIVATRAISGITIPIGVPVELDMSPDPSIFFIALAMAALTGFLFGLAPAFGSTRLDLVTSLKDGVASSSPRSARGRSWFVAGQITVAAVLLIIAGLFIRSLRTASVADIGFDPTGVVVGTINLGPQDMDEAERRAFFTELQRRLRANPDVQSVALTRLALLSGSNMTTDVKDPTQKDGPEFNAGMNAADTAFFKLLGMNVIAGRTFTTADVVGVPPVVVVNEALASRMWPGRNPVGRTLNVWDDDMTVVGVVKNAKYNSLTDSVTPYAFVSLEQDYASMLAVHVRSSAPAGLMLERLRRETNAIAPAVAIEDGRSVSEMAAATLFANRFAAGLVSIFGVIGLTLAALGIYGVLSFQVAQRTREFGVRVAIGASENDVLGEVLRLGVKLAVIGGVTGLILAAAATRVLRSFLYEIQPLDPVTFVAVPLILGGVALVASYVPARRATRIPPTEALRAQ